MMPLRCRYAIPLATPSATCSALTCPTPPGFALHVAEGVASGMAYLHRKGIMHRDLKSANVLLVTSGGSIGTVKLTDFGVSVEVRHGRSPLDQTSAAGPPAHSPCLLPRCQVGHTVNNSASGKQEMSGEVGTLRWSRPSQGASNPKKRR